MTEQDQFDSRPAGLAMAASAGAGLFPLLHHPTSFDGADDGRLLADMANGVVQGGMIAVLLGLAVGGAMAIGAPAWAVVGGGRLELVTTVVSMVMVSIWSALVGVFLLGRDKRGAPA